MPYVCPDNLEVALSVSTIPIASDVQVPKDGEIIQAFMDAERGAFLQPPLPNSTFASDVASIIGEPSPIPCLALVVVALGAVAVYGFLVVMPDLKS